VANADEREILKYWEGLGYYARAKNLHKASKIIASEYGGEVPCDYERLLLLPGIGPYTAAAIASVAGNHDVAVIDANVARVYARLFDIARPVKDRQAQKLLGEIADNLLPRGQARAYNQALMDLGGLVCTPRSPHCPKCPVAASCEALRKGTVAERPAIGFKKKIITLYKVAGIICWNGKIFIQQRRKEDVWGGLWEFPGGEVLKEEKADTMVTGKIFDETGLSVTLVQPITRVIHQYTNHKIFLHSFLCTLAGKRTEPILSSAVDHRWIYPAEIDQFAFPAGPRKVLEYIKAQQLDMLSARF
jgi:A/G-specific adenine glycosylase